MKMEPPHHHHNHHEHDDGQVQDHNLYYHHSQQGSAVSNSTVPTSFYWENSAFHSLPLSMMPLKSDGSLCIIEALNKSQTQVMMPSSSPKLEDFLGGATMGSDQYGDSEREAMALSLDSIYYNQNAHESQTSRDFLSDPFRQHPYYSGLACNSIYQTPLDEEQETKQPHVTVCSSSQMPQVGDEGTACFKNWEQQVNNSTTSIGDGVIASGSPSGSVGVVGRVSSAQHCGNLQSLSLSMSHVSQSNCVTVPSGTTPTESVVMETKKRGSSKLGQKHTVHRKSIDTFGQRTSQYRGVTRHRWTGRYEAHLWDNSCKKEGQTRKGRQVYLGGYDMEEKAARAYDLAALKYWGSSTHINFPLQNYQMQLEEMKNMSRQEFVAHLRRKSSGFSRGASIYRGVTRHHQHGRWQARIGRVAGNKDLYLGTFSTQEEAAEAYDVAAIKFRGVNAVTNFDISRYHVENIMASNTLLTGEQARRNNKDSEPRTETIKYNVVSSQISNKEELEAANNNNETNGSDWNMVLYHQSPQQQQQKQ
ncbi:PREDICTED: AP2-like ethylene-responsive transcription factor AIL1 isoform X2 [Lupinus angustifolius]|uniref:AP2-like ethylene-responsive transcription factor AIL1 isoform X2 n=1 Tax=Lupinus angustifolius TaxID=3871 RepID=UPI00092FD682|nr:PREDICTED: AP2-like ethylene-responsive transcription factor AIL1 isoform X2 [Lupinus angustifolius]